jgi:hypothetical protein
LPNKGRQLKIYFKFRPFRAAKIWPKAILPRVPVGLMELDKRAAFGQGSRHGTPFRFCRPRRMRRNPGARAAKKLMVFILADNRSTSD